MKSKALIAACLAALGIGVMIGWFGPHRGNQEADRDPRSSSRSPRQTEPQAFGYRAWHARIAAKKESMERVRGMVALAADLPEEKLYEWFTERHFATGDDRLDSMFEAILSDRLLAYDPQRFVEWSLARGQGGRILERWAYHDGAAAEAYLLSLNSPSEILRLAPDLIRARAEMDPDAALLLIEKIQSLSQDNAGVALRGLAALATRNRERLLTQANQWEEDWRRAALEWSAAAWMREDFNDAIKWMQTQEQESDLFFAALLRFGTGSVDLSTRLAQLPGEWRAKIAETHYGRLVMSNPLGWLQADAESLGVNRETHIGLQQAAVSALRGTSHAEARHLLTSVAPEVQDTLVKRITAFWASKDRAATEEWINELSDPRLRSLAEAALPTEQAHAAAGVERLPPAEFFPRMLAEFDEQAIASRRWQETDFESWRALPPTQRTQLAAGILEVSWGVPEWLRGEALLLTAESMPEHLGTADDPSFLHSVSEHAAQWGRTEPQRAAKWALALPPGEAQTWAVRNLVQAWAGQAPDEARSWIDNLADPALRTAAQAQIEQ